MALPLGTEGWVAVCSHAPFVALTHWLLHYWFDLMCSRDTIHIEGIELGFKKPVLFERHAVGGEYSAGFKFVGRGNVKTVFNPEVRSRVAVPD